MGKVKIGKSHSKNKHTGSPVESALSEEEICNVVDIQIEDSKGIYPSTDVIVSAIKSEPIVLRDNRARQYAKALRKELLNKAESKSIELLNKRMDLQSIDLDSVVEDINSLHDKSDILKLEKDIDELKKENNKLTHQIELIEQDLKVKPIHIKETKTLERFDHRLLIINLVLIFLNIILIANKGIS